MSTNLWVGTLASDVQLPVVSDPERVQAWLAAAVADARRRGLAELEPLLQGLAEATGRLRRAGWNDHASGPQPAPAAEGTDAGGSSTA